MVHADGLTQIQLVELPSKVRHYCIVLGCRAPFLFQLIVHSIRACILIVHALLHLILIRNGSWIWAIAVSVL